MRIVLVAGELSGDLLGEGVVRLLKARYPNAIIEGIAGAKMAAAGCKSLYPMDTLSVMGLAEVLKHLPQILKLRKKLLTYLKQNKPDIYIGIDAPDFNLGIEKKLKSQGVKTAHYVSPSVWAWREGRIKKIKKATDVVFAILPFEVGFYQKHQHKAVFVGHPLANKIPLEEQREEVRQLLGVSCEDKLVALLPGSRVQEVERNLPVFLKALEILRKSGKAFNTILPVAKPALKPILDQCIRQLDQLNITLTDGRSHQVLKACDFALVASGTATLETMLYKKPMVVGYRVSAFTAMIVKRLLKIKYVSLPNIIAGDAVIPEHIQENFTPENCAKSLSVYFDDAQEVAKLKSKFIMMHRDLQQNTDQQVVEEITKLLNS